MRRLDNVLWSQEHQETPASVCHPSVRADAHAPWTRHLSPDESLPPFHERTFSRWDARDSDWVSLNQAAITEVVPSGHAQALVIDASFVPTRGKYTYGLDCFWNGRHSRAEKGLAISTWAWLDRTDPCADGLRVEQTPLSADHSDPYTMRMDVYLDHSAGWSRRMTGVSGVTSSPMALTANRHSSLAGETWGDTRLVSCEPSPLRDLDRDPSAQVQVANRPTMATSTGTTYRASNASPPQMNTACCTLIKCSTMGR